MRTAMVVLVAVVWTFLWGDLSWANVLAGVVVGLVLVALFDHPGRGSFTVRPLRAARFALEFARRLVVSSLVVAWEVVTPRTRVREGIVRVVVPRVTPEVQVLISGAISLTPGTLVIDIAERDARTVFYVHVLHLRDLSAVRADLTGYAGRAIEAFAVTTAPDVVVEELG